MILKGNVDIGSYNNSAEIITVNFPGDSEFVYEVKETLKVSSNLTVLPGGKIDGLGVIHGPLVYCGIEFPSDGGIHYSGTAFSHSGLAKEKCAYYSEECVEYLLQQLAEGVKPDF